MLRSAISDVCDLMCLCLWVCGSVYLHSRRKMAWAVITNLCIHIVYGSCLACIDPEVKGHGHVIIRCIAGMGLHVGRTGWISWLWLALAVVCWYLTQQCHHTSACVVGSFSSLDKLSDRAIYFACVNFFLFFNDYIVTIFLLSLQRWKIVKSDQSAFGQVFPMRQECGGVFLTYCGIFWQHCAVCRAVSK